jgi:hypothetical protein
VIAVNIAFVAMADATYGGVVGHRHRHGVSEASATPVITGACFDRSAAILIDNRARASK